MELIEDIEVIVGTYEEFLLGYKAKIKDGKPSFLPTFSTNSHTASVRSIAVCDKYLASGGADDKIFIYDMDQRRESQILMHHEGTVNALIFSPDSKLLISGGEDGQLFVIKVGSWKVLNYWEKAHDGTAVRNIACHPSGKVLLTLGQDLVLRTWSLISGKCLHKVNFKSNESLGKSPECIEWSPNGNNFLISGLRVVQVISVETSKTLKEIKLNCKPVCACWISEDAFVLGLEDGKIAFCSINESEKEVMIDGDSKRIKAMSCLNNVLASASSSGEIVLWKINLENRSLKKIVSTNIGCRPTCISLLNLEKFKNSYLLKEEEDATEEVKSLKKSISRSDLKNLQRVVIEYESEDESKVIEENGKDKESDESEEDNNAGLFVRLNKKRKIEDEPNEKAKKSKKKFPKRKNKQIGNKIDATVQEQKTTEQKSKAKNFNKKKNKKKTNKT